MSLVVTLDTVTCQTADRGLGNRGQIETNHGTSKKAMSIMTSILTGGDPVMIC